MGVASYNKVFRKLHRYGIASVIGTIYGFPSETYETVDKRVAFFRNCKADSIQSTVMTPLPGTEFFRKMERENRLEFTNFPEDWRLYSFEELVFRPDFHERKELSEYIVKKVRKGVYESSLVKNRFYRTWRETGSLSTAYLSYMSYWFYRNAVYDTWEEGRLKWVEWLLYRLNAWDNPTVPPLHAAVSAS